jgi:uncharacterized membrane protein
MTHFIAGLLIWIPLGITVPVLNWLVGTMDQSLGLLPDKYRSRCGGCIPGFGAVVPYWSCF